MKKKYTFFQSHILATPYWQFKSHSQFFDDFEKNTAKFQDEEKVFLSKKFKSKAELDKKLMKENLFSKTTNSNQPMKNHSKKYIMAINYSQIINHNKKIIEKKKTQDFFNAKHSILARNFIFNCLAKKMPASSFDKTQLITIGLASPKQITKWAETVLPYGKIVGQVINANTLDHKHLKPIKGGLFCERIFGPVKDFICSCGIEKEKPLNRKLPRINRQFCPKCEVEYTWSDKRRYQLGFIQLASPVTHLWYLKGNPSYISILLDMKKKQTEAITYCMDILTLDVAWKPGRYFCMPIFFRKQEINQFFF
jgi:DNA-directed RNA polymerase subunit beta'